VVQVRDTASGWYAAVLEGRGRSMGGKIPTSRAEKHARNGAPAGDVCAARAGRSMVNGRVCSKNGDFIAALKSAALSTVEGRCVTQ
jgi:hypothetical protein